MLTSTISTFYNKITSYIIFDVQLSRTLTLFKQSTNGGGYIVRKYPGVPH